MENTHMWAQKILFCISALPLIICDALGKLCNRFKSNNWKRIPRAPKAGTDCFAPSSGAGPGDAAPKKTNQVLQGT